LVPLPSNLLWWTLTAAAKTFRVGLTISSLQGSVMLEKN